jgi:hypothetical protein
LDVAGCGVEGLFSTIKSQTVLALYFAGASMSALAAVYDLPADGSAVVGTDSRTRLIHIPLDEASDSSRAFPGVKIGSGRRY